MEFIEAMKIKKSMCKGRACGDCPLGKASKQKCTGCTEYCLEHPEEAEKILIKWDKEHPRKTILMDFLEKHPNAPLDDDGTPQDVCPFALGYVKNGECYLDDGNDCIPCWNRPMEE